MAMASHTPAKIHLYFLKCKMLHFESVSLVGSFIFHATAYFQALLQSVTPKNWYLLNSIYFTHLGTSHLYRPINWMLDKPASERQINISQKQSTYFYFRSLFKKKNRSTCITLRCVFNEQSAIWLFLVWVDDAERKTKERKKKNNYLKIAK